MLDNSNTSINHYIITRFNITLSNQVLNNQIDRIDVHTDYEYLHYRFAIFEKYTVPSIKKQTEKNFFWLVLFSSQTPEIFKQKIRKIQLELPNFRPVFLDNSNELQTSLFPIFQRERTGTLVTSRLDNDDAISLNFIEIIQKNIKQNGKTELLVFPDGIQYDMNQQVMTKYHFPKNHFSTLVCDQDNKIETILGYNHMEIHKFFDVRFLSEHNPMWLEIIHGGNILNRMFLKFSTLIFDFSILDKFGYKDLVKSRNRMSIFLLVIFNKPLNAIQLIKKYGLRKILKKLLNRIN